MSCGWKAQPLGCCYSEYTRGIASACCILQVQESQLKLHFKIIADFSLFFWYWSNQVISKSKSWSRIKCTLSALELWEEKKPKKARTIETSEWVILLDCRFGAKNEVEVALVRPVVSFLNMYEFSLKLGKHSWSPGFVFFHHNLKTSIPQPCCPSECSGEHWKNYRFLAVTPRPSDSVGLEWVPGVCF